MREVVTGVVATANLAGAGIDPELLAQFPILEDALRAAAILLSSSREIAA